MTSEELLEQYFLARALWWRSAMLDMEEAAVTDLLIILKKVKQNLGSEIADFEWQIDRLEALGAFCDELILAAKAQSLEAITEATVAAGTASLANWNQMLSVEKTAAFVSFAEMSREQVKSWFQTTPLGGHLLKDWVDKAYNEGIRKALAQSLRESAVRGLGYQPMVREALKAGIETGAQITQREAITLARTYTQTANVEAQKAVYEKNSDIVYGRRWVSVLDNRVCPRCASLDGRIYERGEEMPPIPLHPRCRCLLLPCVRVGKMGVSSEDLELVARPWTVRVPGNIDTGGKRKILSYGHTKENFGGWYPTLPEKEQTRIVGPVRQKLLKDGKITFDELVDKRTGRLRTLAELGYSENGKKLPPNGIFAEANKIREELSRPEAREKTQHWLKSITTRLENGIYKGTGEREIIGVLDDKALEFINQHKIPVSSPGISISDKDLMHALRTNKHNPLPIDIWKGINEIIANPKGIYWDEANPAFIYVFEMPNLKGKIIVQSNADVKYKRKQIKTNNIRTGGAIPNFNEFENYKRYKKIK